MEQSASSLASLNYTDHKQDKLTLHIFFQIMGKIRMCFTSRKNHWWYTTLYVYEKGFTTGLIPINEGYEAFSLKLNILQNKLEITKSTGDVKYIELYKGLSVAAFYNNLINNLEDIDIHVKMNEKPYDLNIEKRFSEITDIHHYDMKYSKAFWKTFLWVDAVFKEFSGRFYGKTCPVHLYWHSMDLAVTRFSGKKAPVMPAEARTSDKDAYSHECISFGFWAGDDNLPEPAFYSYTYPAPEGIDKKPIHPKKAKWIMNNNSPMAVFTYADLTKEKEPRKALLEFLESTYKAGAELANWDIEKFVVPALTNL